MTTYPARIDPNGCWEWQGPLNHHGYGLIRTRSDNRTRFHRRSFEIAYGPIPTGMIVCHRCDNPACFRPDHLFLGTQRDNMHDMAAKGRKPKPVILPMNAPGRKLDTERVAELRRLYGTGEYTQHQLAAHFGISQSQVSNIVRGWHWRAATPLA